MFQYVNFKNNVKAITLIAAVITLCGVLYLAASWSFIYFEKVVVLELSGAPQTAIEKFVYPYWYSEKWASGAMAKSRYRDRLAVGFEDDVLPLDCNNFEFFFFYMGYKDAIKEPGAFVGCFICPEQYYYGCELGRTAMPRVIQRNLREAGIVNMQVSGIGDRLLISGPRDGERAVDDFLSKLKASDFAMRNLR